jgi:hypothetical protein
MSCMAIAGFARTPQSKQMGITKKKQFSMEKKDVVLNEDLTNLHEGLQILELEERFEMVQLTSVVAAGPTPAQSTRCDVTTK